MSARLSEDADIAVVTFSAPAAVRAYRVRRSLDVPILVDHDRAVYRAYGLGRGTRRRVWGWATIKRYGQILRQLGWRRGWRELSSTDEDTLQLGGDFVIAPDGTIAFAHRGDGPADRPDIDAIVAAVDGTTR